MSKLTAALGVATLLAAMIACGGDSDDTGSTPQSSSGYSVTVSAADRFAIGPTRFVFLLANPLGKPVTNAQVHMRFFYIDPVRNDRKTFKVDFDATQVELDQAYELVAADGMPITVGPGATGIYANETAFDQVGNWIADITGTDGNNNLGTIEVAFPVGETPAGPRSGQPAPALEDGPADGPVMVVFGKAGICYTFVCGPLVEIAHEVEGSLGGALPAEYIELEEGSDGPVIPDWASAWGVGPEPAVFFVDADGFVRGRLHTLASYQETEALARTLLP